MTGTTSTVACTVALWGAIVALGACGGAGPINRGPVDPLPDINAVSPGAGCAKPLPSFQQETVPGTPKGYTHYTVMGTGATLAGTIPAKAGPRTFWVRVPADYDPNRPYRVVYLGQGCGSSQVANIITTPLFRESLGGAEQAIYVALDIPQDMANMDCYDDAAGLASQEWEAFQLFHEVVDANYCVDNNRIFVAGYSTGGDLANMWGCYFAGDGQKPAEAPATPRRFAPRFHIRGQLAERAGEPAEQPPCGGPVASLILHDDRDPVFPLSGAILALQRVGRMNGCDTNYHDTTIQEPWHPELPLLDSLCKRFTKCPADHPVVFCTTSGITGSDQLERVTLAFTRFVDELPPPR